MAPSQPMPNSPSTDLGLSHSYHNDCPGVKSSQKINLVPAIATETNSNIEGIPAHSNVNSKEVITLDTHNIMLIQDAYEAEKQEVLIQSPEGFVSMMIKILEQQFAGVHWKDCVTW